MTLITGCCSCTNTIVVEIQDHKDYRDCRYICSECSSKSTAITKEEYVGEILDDANTNATNSMGFQTKSIISREATALGKLKELVCEYTIVN